MWGCVMLAEQMIMPSGKVYTKLEIAIQRLKTFEPSDGYYVAFSGGKDSQCIYHLCEMADVKFTAHYNVTSIDPPELIYFIRKNYPEVIFDIPKDENGKRITMWTLIQKYQMPPTRLMRYCCEQLKEKSGEGRIVVSGVRWAESVRRRQNQGSIVIIGKTATTKQKADEIGAEYKLCKKNSIVMNADNDINRRLVENCYRTQKTMVNPIVDWTDDDVWEFINDVAKVPHCCLYDEGYRRIGCIGCPMSGGKMMALGFERYPKYRALYGKAFERMIATRKANGLQTTWETSEDVFRWWLQ